MNNTMYVVYAKHPCGATFLGCFTSCAKALREASRLNHASKYPQLTGAVYVGTVDDWEAFRDGWSTTARQW